MAPDLGTTTKHSLKTLAVASALAIGLAACQSSPLTEPGASLSMGDRAQGETDTGRFHFGARNTQPGAGDS